MHRPPFECTALVLQGGGALGSYQGGVYEALAEAKLHPDWVAGISIGAVNAALIGGNAPEKRVERLREFWEAGGPLWNPHHRGPHAQPWKGRPRLPGLRPTPFRLNQPFHPKGESYAFE
jgi:predicted acylesterase/phospholipase RssA